MLAYARVVEDASDGALLTRWAAGERDAGDELLARHFEWIHRFFFAKLPAIADDLVQQTMLSCVEQVQRLPDVSSFRAYVFGIARNHLNGALRERYAGRFDSAKTSLVQAVGQVTGGFSRRIAERAVYDALARLPVDEQLLLELRYWHDLSSREIADVLEVPSPTIRARLGRAREHLRRELGRGRTRAVSQDAVMRLLTR